MNKKKVLYLTFDDGPNAQITDWILKTLNDYNAKATFFCIGNQAKKHPELMTKISLAGHSVGNHGMSHLNGFKTSCKKYIEDVSLAQKVLNTNLFRPPYGKLTFKQFKALKKKNLKIIFWSLLSYDYDKKVQPSRILKAAKSKLKSGDIIIFHDNKKSFERLKILLPDFLIYYTKLSYRFEVIINDKL